MFDISNKLLLYRFIQLSLYIFGIFGIFGYSRYSRYTVKKKKWQCGDVLTLDGYNSITPTTRSEPEELGRRPKNVHGMISESSRGETHVLRRTEICTIQIDGEIVVSPTRPPPFPCVQQSCLISRGPILSLYFCVFKRAMSTIDFWCGRLSIYTCVLCSFSRSVVDQDNMIIRQFPKNAAG